MAGIYTWAMGKGAETESFCAVRIGHTEITEILGFRFQDSSFRSRRKRRERRTLMVQGYFWFMVNGYFNLNANVNCFEHELHGLNE